MPWPHATRRPANKSVGRVRALDPTNVRAAAVLACSRRLKKESATREICGKSRRRARDGDQDAAGASSRAGLSRRSPGRGPLEQRVGPPREDAVTKYRQLMNVRGQQLTQEVNGADRRRAQDRSRTIPTPASWPSSGPKAASPPPPTSSRRCASELPGGCAARCRNCGSIKERQTVGRSRTPSGWPRSRPVASRSSRCRCEETRLTELIDQVPGSAGAGRPRRRQRLRAGRSGRRARRSTSIRATGRRRRHCTTPWRAAS